MNNLESIYTQWEQDCKISESDLEASSRNTPILHGKYLRMYSNAKMLLVKFEMEQKILLKKKWLYYNGKMTPKEIKNLEWDFDPFNGLRVLKGEMNYYYDADTDIQKSEKRIQYQKEIVSTLKEIIDNLKWRHQTIKNILDYRRFEAGG